MISDELEGAAANSARILLVDDDERNLLALSEILSPLGEVVCVASGRDALRELLKQDFAVILLDVFMPELDGYETAALIRERSRTAHVPIIFLSAVNKEMSHLIRGYEMGAVDYVFKPVDAVILRSKVGVFVDLYNVRRQVERQAEAERVLREAHFNEQLNRMVAERKLQDSERRQASILKALPMAIYEADEKDGKFERVFVGGDLTYFLGNKSSALLSGERQFGEWVCPDDLSKFERIGSRTADSVNTEYRWIGPDGRKRHLLDQRILTTDSGKSHRWAGTVIDITERKELEARLVHAGKLDSLGQLTGGVAHDFNNLLAAILGGIDILDRRLSLGEAEKRVIHQMRYAGDQGTELVRRMMAFARQQELTPTSVDPSSLCDTVAGLVKHTLGGSVTVSWQCPDSSLNLFVDRGQLELALVNLIINARDAMPDGGEIEVSIEKVERKAASEPGLRIRVRDSGTGMSEDVLAKVTEPFFTTKETGKGTGLGLSMVAGFVDQSRGELIIESAQGEGTTIDLILQATDEASEACEENEDRERTWLSKKRLALIDDDDGVRIVLAEQFRDTGALVDEFASGQEALDAVRKSPDLFDLVLSDFAMPGMDGLQTLQGFKAIAPGARTVLMTGNADDGRLIKDMSVPVVRKPIRLKTVVDAFKAKHHKAGGPNLSRDHTASTT